MVTPPLAPASSRRTFRIVRRPKQIGLFIEKGEDLLLLPDVIARCQHVDTSREELSSALDVNPHPAGRVLGIRNGKVNPLFPDQGRHELPHSPPRRATHNIA